MDARQALQVGYERHDRSRREGVVGRYGNANDVLAREADGQAACAEHLVSVALDSEWISVAPGRDNPALGDVAGGVCVRWTSLKQGSLILHPEDPDDLHAVLVVGDHPGQKIVGWLPVSQGKRNEWWRTAVRCPCFMVPQMCLRPMSDWVFPPTTRMF